MFLGRKFVKKIIENCVDSAALSQTLVFENERLKRENDELKKENETLGRMKEWYQDMYHQSIVNDAQGSKKGVVVSAKEKFGA